MTHAVQSRLWLHLGNGPPGQTYDSERQRQPLPMARIPALFTASIYPTRHAGEPTIELCKFLIRIAPNAGYWINLWDHGGRQWQAKLNSYLPGDVAFYATEQYVVYDTRALSSEGNGRWPSRADIEMTKTIIDTAKPLGIAVHDHIIIGKTGHASMKGLLLI
jgi:hypothetical protein